MCEPFEDLAVPVPEELPSSASSSAADPCLERVAAYTLASMRLKPEKWQKMIATQECRLIVRDWIDNPQRQLLVMALHPAGYLLPKVCFTDFYSKQRASPSTATMAETALAAAATAANTAPERFSADAAAASTTAVDAENTNIVVPSAALVTATATATTVATAALLAPLPPPNSSFSTLDGVPRGKCVFFLRRQLGAALRTPESLAGELLFGDLPVHSRAATLSILFDEIYSPLLTNCRNRSSWPEVVARDVEARMKDVRNTLAEIRGKSHNRTILSLLVSPAIIQHVEAEVDVGNIAAALEPKFLGQLEETFINWTTQIDEVVRREAHEQPALSRTGAAITSAAPHSSTTTLPAHEILFWANRKTNLQDIYEQLRSPSHKSLAHILERSGSPYHQPFARVFQQLVQAWQEAEDVSLWLQPLLRQTAALKAANFSHALELVEPLVHVVHLIWTHSRHYRSTQRMSTLLRCICNLLVHLASEELQCPLLFQGDVDEGLQKVSKTIEVLEFFKFKCNEYKQKFASRRRTSPPAVDAHTDSRQLWCFSKEDVFGRGLDGFLLQLGELRSVFEAAVLFQHLERFEVGGLRGRSHTQQVRQIHAEFKQLFEQWTHLDIDLARRQDAKWCSFQREQRLFFARMQLLEKRLASLLLRTFNDCSNWEQLTKLGLMFCSMLRRPAVRPELQALLPHFCAVFAADLQQLECSVHDVLLVYEIQSDLAVVPVDRNLPPAAGAMMWIEKHARRCAAFAASQFDEFVQELIAGGGAGPAAPYDAYAQLCARRDILTTKLSQLQMHIWQHWLQSIDARIAAGLDQPVLVRGTGTALEVNNSGGLFELLKETKYLLAMLHMQPTPLLSASFIGADALASLPEPLLRLYESRNEFWRQRVKLIKISNYYNGVQQDEHRCGELQLVQSELAEVDKSIDAACSTSTWRSCDSSLIDSIYTRVRQLHQRLQQAHSNLDALLASVRRWSREPLHQRSLYGRNLLDLRHQQERTRVRTQQCEDSARLIRRLLIANFCLFFGCAEEDVRFPETNARDSSVQQFMHAFPEKQRQQYTAYLAAVDEMVIREVRQSMKISLEFLHSEMSADPHSARSTPKRGAHLPLQGASVANPSSLFEVKLELTDTTIVFAPTFDSSEANSFQHIVAQLLRDIHQTCNSVPRIVEPREGSEAGEETAAAAEEAAELQALHASIDAALAGAVKQAARYADTFKEFECLWTQRKEDVLRATLSEIRGKQSPAQGFVVMEVFRREIDRYMELHDDIERLDSHQTINGWLSIDSTPLKYSLLNHACKWASHHKRWLLRYVQRTLQALTAFIACGARILGLLVQREDFRTLLRVLSVMAQIQQRATHAEHLFKPLREIAALLKAYNVDFDAQLLQRIEQLPLQWKQLKDAAAARAEALLDTRSYQQQRLGATINMFSCRLNAYARKFEKLAFFQVPCADVYELCDDVCARLTRFSTLQQRLTRNAELLGVATPDASNLLLCAAEMKRVKQLWDFVHVIQSCVAEWKCTAWQRIDADEVENECKSFSRELRTLDKSVREWLPYTYIAGVLKDLVASLRAITELQNPAVTERHWLQLMQATKLHFKCDRTTTFSELLNLQLHEHEEDIKNTVDRATKEATVNKVLDEIKATWSHLEFETEPHPQRELQLLRVSEELLDTLDDNQVQLQNIANSKHIENLIDKLTHWQHTLSRVDALISSWFEVQRKWFFLESIFIGSPDIRSQLPADASRFEQIDAEFTQLLSAVVHVKVVLQVVAQQTHLFTTLGQLQQRLAICEKALNDYLETKRLTFPRFYFISSDDLLDILSSGNKPRTIDRHLVKLFDSILRLEYASPHANRAVGMHSKENDEFVRFEAPASSTATADAFVECTGRVELWLSEVVTRMHCTLHALFRLSLHAFPEKPRDRWLADWPAQVVLCCSQIFWTADVNRAFARMEEGYEAAMRDLHKRQVTQLNALINLLLGELRPGDRQKVMTVCTIDVHSRDVVGKIIQAKVDSALAFAWQSQLRHRWDKAAAKGAPPEDCFANICDAEFRYAYEYLGNTSRLVVTPLTDRCYITLTQSLHLVMGGAPAGPAGTGKTETTKDLGRAMGVMVYVFNCSEQMDYRTCGNIYKGLAQSGAWGCFDEFNRISVEVLSVVAVQVKCIQEAVKLRKRRFVFMGESISLVPSVGIFITMNPGYAGRTELPENLKTLFRPCAMIVPDFALICEIMLMAEGFQDARLLARKFITLYTLCRELLSKQDHYDWGLRAIKSVLVVAGALKRDDHSRPEDQVLMRALRDFNIPKIVTEDVSIFMGLIGDLFPALEVPRKRVFDFERTIRRAVGEIRLQPEEKFLMKVVQLQELLDVRHSVFIVGNAGTGKTSIWQALRETYRVQKLKPVCSVLNPKALTNDELFGTVNTATREWKDGLFSSIMREEANLASSGPKWIVLDGDIDPMWIESLNTLMDDNKVLTLASNERIALKREMRLLFEVGHLKAATPATVSRAGILYVNPQDLGWSPYVSSWLETRSDVVERGVLNDLFEKYFPVLMQRQADFRRITPVTDISMVQMTCYLLECLLDEARSNMSSPSDPGSFAAGPHTLQRAATPADSLEATLELFFTYATIWGFGSALHQDHATDWRHEFHKWWNAEFKDIKFPTLGTVFEYHLDVRTQSFQRWDTLAVRSSFVIADADAPLQDVLVPTGETTRLSFFLKLLMNRNRPCMLVGTAGCGKGAIFREIFSSYASAQELQLQSAVMANASRKPLPITVQTTHFNFYTTSELFQKSLERQLEKKSGRCYAPSGPARRLIFFVNDLNMPEVDAYGTVQPHTIMRQFMDYGQWYDRQRLQLKDIRQCQFAACMNPTAGSFTVDPRLQRHFCVFSLALPSEDTLRRIYGGILSAHLDDPQHGFSKEIRCVASLLVQVGVALHRRVEHAFPATAVKFHYLFNLRDLTGIFQGVLRSTGAGVEGMPPPCSGTICSKPSELVRLYVHEAHRVYHDRLVDPHDIKAFKTAIRDAFKKDFEDFDEDFVFAEPLVYSHFAQSLVDTRYMPLRSWASLSQLLLEAQANYNEAVGYMNLVMFEDAMVHVCRINRILESPRGNALLIGVGGSGKQTLARLAAFISAMNLCQVQLKRGFGLQDMKDEIAALYMRAGLKNVPSVFLLSDAQIPDEVLLTLINNLLATGEIPELFSDDQLEAIVSGIRNEVKQSGSLDTADNCWRFFVDKVRRQLKVVLCFSPVGQTLRVRARKFPALLSRTTIDWFHEWPQAALESVSQKFLSEMGDVLTPSLIAPIGCFMAFVHGTVNQMSKIFLQNEKRYNYTTPKTFLEYVFLYRKLLVQKSGEHEHRIQRLHSGMAKLVECSRQVDALKDQLALQEVQLNAKNAAADKLIVIVSAESEKVKNEKIVASEEERRVRVIEEDVCMKTKLCEEDLRKAEPALVAAQAALNTLNKTNLTELKSFGSPPKAVVNVCAAVMVLLANNGKPPRDRSWKAAKLMMARVDQFLGELVNYNKDNIHPSTIEALQGYLQDPEFSPDRVVQKSVAAAGLCAWIINLHRYHEVFLIVGPKQRALHDAQDELRQARQRLQFLKAKTNELEARLGAIQAEFEQAVAEKHSCQREADRTAFTLDLAHRLLHGLAGENVRWKESVKSLQTKLATLPGDILLICSFLSYVGCFTRRYRQELQHRLWMPQFRKVRPAIPHTEHADPLAVFSDDAQIARWNNEGLPMDRMSTENATILTHSTRWPLMIDPQLQGIKWIKTRYGDSLVVVRLTQRAYLEVLERAMARGDTVLIEQIEEVVDAVLEPLLSRALIKKGRCVRVGDKEVDLNPDFRLILHTKMANPHYKPEMQAQTTLVNFTVTPDGLEEQLLAEVVRIERPDLERLKTEVTTKQNSFKIALKQLEDELLARLASAGENVLDDHALVANLETTKRTVDEIELKVSESRATTQQIDEARNIYRAAAKRAAVLYFVLTDLSRINPLYRFSLKSFLGVFRQAIAVAPQDRKLERRVAHLVDSITLQTFLYTLRGLFEADKLIFTAHMILRVMSSAQQIPADEIDFLLRFPHDPNALSPLDFIDRGGWGGIKSLALIDGFYGLDKDIESYPKRWRQFLANSAPESEPFPGEWKRRSALQRLCILRALRPDRMTYAMRLFVHQTMGRQYAEVQQLSFADVFKEITACTPVFFILSPGVDPLRDIERLGVQLGFQESEGTLLNISLGQGQEPTAERAVSEAHDTADRWVILQNIHLVVSWLPTLEKLIERLADDDEASPTTSNFRLFISAEPAPDPQYHVIPQGILESSLKVVNEPPSGLAANLHKAWDNFGQETLEACTQEAEFKAILFALCYFHAVAGERRKFGPQGWNQCYPFNAGDLGISAHVLHNYLEGSSRIPWEDLRYLFGEIMYGGHITDDWDRRLCRTHLEELLQQQLVEGDFQLCPGFPAPPNLDFQGYHDYVEEMLPAESPVLYGLHPNAEIGFLTSASDNMLRTIFELQPRESELSTHYGAPREELVRIMIDEFLDKLQVEFNLQALLNRVERKTPFVVVALQECERMNALIREVRRSLRELLLGLKGELTITQEMERLDHAVFYDHIPEAWSRLAYPSMLGLQGWFADLLQRTKELSGWLGDFKLPCTIWLGGLFNPQSFLTAIMQESARKHDLPLDRLCLSCDVTKKGKDDVTLPPLDGAFVHGLYLDGASWDCQLNSIVSLRPKELWSPMPVVYIRSLVQERQELLRVYECPLYKTRSRGSTFVWTFNLKTRERPAKWVLAGVALLLQP